MASIKCSSMPGVRNQKSYNMKNFGSVILALLVILVFALGAGVLAGRAFSDFSGEAALGLLTFAGTMWFAIWNFNKTKQKEADAQFFPEKAKVYKQIIDIMRDVMFAQKGWIPNPDETEIAQRFARARYDLIIWGGKSTVGALEAFETQSATEDTGKMFLSVANLYDAIRLELGHKSDERLGIDLVMSQIILEDRDKFRKLLEGAAEVE